MRVVVRRGDILGEEADVIVSTANVNLAMSGGVSGAILRRGGGDVQQALADYLRGTGRDSVPPGSVVLTGPGPLRAKHLLHAVSIDESYGSSVGLVRRTIEGALSEAAGLGARSVALPALATGYGPLLIHEFAEALKGALGRTYEPIEELRVIVWDEGEAEIVSEVLGQ
jgi:O-acetyl-ADP-ribose deacetylase (regulator of RNase III)